MNAYDVLTLAQQQGVQISLKGKGLHLEAKTPPTPALLADLKAHKAELIALLASNDSTAKHDRYRVLTTCQQCANLTLGGGCRMKAGYKPIPNAKRDCKQHQPLQEARELVAATPYTADELNALLERYERRLLLHVVNCPDCRISDRRWCGDGFAAGSAYDALLMVFDDADDRHQTFVDRVIKARVITGDYPYR